MSETYYNPSRKPITESATAIVLVSFGVVVVAIGVALTAAVPFLPSDSPTTIKVGAAAFGSIATIVGGVAVSWIIATASSSNEAHEQVNRELDTMSRNLAQIYVRIMDAVEAGQSGAYTSMETPLALIAQSANEVYGQVTEIQAVRGGPFEGAPIVETKRALDELAGLLVSDRSVDIAKAREVVAEARADLSRIRVSRAIGESSDEVVACPNCSVRQDVRLGLPVGSTANTRCPRCGGRFNTHRRNDGSVVVRAAFTPSQLAPRSPAAARVRQYAKFTCPCGHLVPATFDPAMNEATKSVLCTRCGRFHDITIPGAEVVATVQFNVVDGDIVGRSGNQPITYCTVCRRPRQCIVNDNEIRAYFGFCVADQMMLRVTYDARDNWLAAHPEATNKYLLAVPLRIDGAPPALEGSVSAPAIADAPTDGGASAGGPTSGAD